ncbi:unnamed protein product [Sphagnum troendelagicum]|uniref:Uncharacterized protein n=1 Tax=Sphagnum troendelagicum TaxID=128251 RepID=A0ABP0U5M8_9BRYO
MSDTGLSSIPGKVCSNPIYTSKKTTVRFFIHSFTSCCSITTPRRSAGSHQALITLWLPCFCGRGIIFSTLLQANAGSGSQMRKTNVLMISDPVSKVIAAAGELKVLKLQKGQQLQVKVKNISGVGDVCACFWMMLSKCFGRVQRLLLWDVSMLLPRNSHPRIYLLLL